MNVVIIENLPGPGPEGTRGGRLLEAVRDLGHRAELVRLPWSDGTSQRLLQSMIALRTMRIAATDRVIALEFPSYHVDHWAKVVWLAERGGTDLVEHAPDADLELGSAVRHADRSTLQSALRVYATTVALRQGLASLSGGPVTVLSTPAPVGRPGADDPVTTWREIAIELCR